jgi:hypothetical protein
VTSLFYLANGLPIRALTVAQFYAMYNLSRQTTYNLINTGQLASVLRGGRRLILVDSAEALLRGHGSAGSFGAGPLLDRRQAA